MFVVKLITSIFQSFELHMLAGGMVHKARLRTTYANLDSKEGSTGGGRGVRIVFEKGL